MGVRLYDSRFIPCASEPDLFGSGAVEDDCGVPARRVCGFRVSFRRAVTCPPQKYEDSSSVRQRRVLLRKQLAVVADRLLREVAAVSPSEASVVGVSGVTV